MRKKETGGVVCFLVLVVLLASGLSLLEGKKKKKGDILFPEREYIRTLSAPFFEKVNLTFPTLTKVDFFVKSQTYRSAFMHLSGAAVKIDYFSKILPAFQAGHPELIPVFEREHLHKLKLEEYPYMMEQLKVDPLTFQLLILNTLFSHYKGNRLSGPNAFKLWVVFLDLTEKAFADKSKINKAEGRKGIEKHLSRVVANAAMLRVASHFVFFKRVPRWRKKSRKILKKASQKYGSDLKYPSLAALILKGAA